MVMMVTLCQEVVCNVLSVLWSSIKKLLRPGYTDAMAAITVRLKSFQLQLRCKRACTETVTVLVPPAVPLIVTSPEAKPVTGSLNTTANT